MSLERVALAATVHDPDDHLLEWLRRSVPALRAVFAGFGVLATEPTSAAVVEVLRDELNATVARVPADGRVGRHRRESVRLAGPDRWVLYSDLDNLLRWITADRRQLAELAVPGGADLVVIGRTAVAMAACPRRLRDTEALVNHAYGLATGREWDLMFAIRLLSPSAARLVIDTGQADSLASDVEWPLLVERAGLRVDYRAAGGLSYRVREDFDAARDQRDGDPLAWIQRVEIAAEHCAVLKRFVTDS